MPDNQISNSNSPRHNEAGFDRQAVLKAEICPYCGAKPKLVDSSIVYRRSLGLIYHCGPRGAYVGVHKGTEKPLGRLADKQLRQAKREAHRAFDPIATTHLIHLIMPEATPGLNARKKAYLWLSRQMAIPVAECHIGMFDLEQCKQVIDICAAVNHDEYPASKDGIAPPAAREHPTVPQKELLPSVEVWENDINGLKAYIQDAALHRMQYAVDAITALGYPIVSSADRELQFIFKGSIVRLYPYKGWFTGRTIKDGRGIENLLQQITGG